MQPIDRAQARAKVLTDQLDQAKAAIIANINGPVSPKTVIVTVSSETGLDQSTVQTEVWNLVHNGDLSLTESLLIELSQHD